MCGFSALDRSIISSVPLTISPSDTHFALPVHLP